MNKALLLLGVLAIACIACAEDAPEAEQSKPPVDLCHLPPELCLAKPQCVNLVVNGDKRHPAGVVCFNIFGPFLDVVIDVGHKPMAAVADGADLNVDADYVIDPSEYAPTNKREEAAVEANPSVVDYHGGNGECHWKLLDSHLWVSTDWDSVPTSPCGRPLPYKFSPYRKGIFPIPQPWKMTDTKWWYRLELAKVLPEHFDIRRLCYDIIWFAAHVHLVCEGGDEGEGEGEECASAWADGEPFQENPEGEGMYNYIQVLCDKECKERPRDHKPWCATSYAVATKDCPHAKPLCFGKFCQEDCRSPRKPAMWGWVNKITEEGHYTFDLFGGGKDCFCFGKLRCDCDMGKPVGNVYVDVDFTYDKPRIGREDQVEMNKYNPPKRIGAHVLVRYVTRPGYYLQETEVWVDNKEPLPNFKWIHNTCKHATFPGWWPQPQPGDHEHEDLFTRVDEYFIGLPKHPDVYKGWCDDHDGRKREEAAAPAPAPAPAPVQPAEEPKVEDPYDVVDFSRYEEDTGMFMGKPTCVDLSEIFVAAHAIVCQGGVICMPHECEHHPRP